MKHDTAQQVLPGISAPPDRVAPAIEAGAEDLHDDHEGARLRDSAARSYRMRFQRFGVQVGDERGLRLEKVLRSIMVQLGATFVRGDVPDGYNRPPTGWRDDLCRRLGAELVESIREWGEQAVPWLREQGGVDRWFYAHRRHHDQGQ